MHSTHFTYSLREAIYCKNHLNNTKHINSNSSNSIYHFTVNSACVNIIINLSYIVYILKEYGLVFVVVETSETTWLAAISIDDGK